jgi:F-type H+-transporting ATPase subunit alpha
VDADKVVAFEAALHSFVKSNYADLVKRINDTADYNDEIAGQMGEALQKFKESSTW